MKQVSIKVNQARKFYDIEKAEIEDQFDFEVKVDEKDDDIILTGPNGLVFLALGMYYQNGEHTIHELHPELFKQAA